MSTFSQIQILRPFNLGLVALSQYILYYTLIKPIAQVIELDLTLSKGLLHILVLSTVTITLCGYLINDYFDYELDSNFKSKKLLDSKFSYLKLYYFFIFIGFIVSFYLAYSIEKIHYTVIYILANIALYLYSSTFKSIPFLGNLIVASFTAFSVLVLAFFEWDSFLNLAFIDTGLYNKTILLILFYAMFTFIINLIREIIKDAEDYNGDKIFNIKTIATQFGINQSKRVAVLLSIIFLISSTGFIYNPILKFNLFELICYLSLIILPISLLILLLLKARQKRDFKQLSQLSKLIMLNGLIFIILYTWN